MTMPHQDRQVHGCDEPTADSGPSGVTPPRPRGRARFWSVAALVGAARMAGDHSSGA